MKFQIPRHGCARCIWWRYKPTNGWGRCVLHREKTWFQHGPCVEYELDAEADEVIEATLEQ